MVISRLFGQEEDKTINDIQQILFFVKTKFINQWEVGITINLIHILRNNQLNYNQRKKSTFNDKCYNCYIMDYFRWDYRIQGFRLAKRKISDIK